MSASQSARTGLTSAPENNHPADATLLAKLQQTATLANENCDRATALVSTLSAELRDAQQRIRDLERRLETESTLSQLQAEFDAEAENHHTRLQTELAQARQRAAEASGRVAQIEKEADERVVRAEAEADERITRAAAEAEGVFARLKREAADAQQRAEWAEAEAERIRREADEHVRRVEADTEGYFEQVRAIAEEQVCRLETELAETKRRAEQRLVQIRQEIDGRLLPAFTPVRNWAPARP